MSTISIIVTIIILIIALTNAQTTRQCVANGSCINQTISASQVDCIGTDACDGATITSNNRKQGYIECSGSSSCSGTTTLSAAGNVDCSGANSCEDITSINGKNIECSGDDACKNSGILTATATIKCSGSSSCEESARLNPGRNKKTICYSGGSCQRSIINGGTTANCDASVSCGYSTLRPRKLACCAGDWSCRDSVITGSDAAQSYGENGIATADIIGVETVKGYAYQALGYGTTVDSDTLSSMTVQMFGARASYYYNTPVICRSGATCSLNCKGDGCVYVTYYCPAGATCNVIPSGCLSDNSVGIVDGVYCPSFSSDAQPALRMESKEKEIPMNNNYYTIPDRDHTDIIIVADNARGTLFDCLTPGSCSNQALNNSGTINCAGAESCVGSTLDQTLNSAYADVYCYGLQACENSVISAKGSVYCVGFKGCIGANIEMGLRVRNRLFGGSPLRVVCDGNYACGESTITSGFYTYCTAKYSCTKATLIKSPFVEASGWMAGARSTIDSKDVTGNGYRTFMLSTIDSGGRPEMVVNINGHLGLEGGTVICRNGAECTLNCVAAMACSTAEYLCETGATCNISPSQCDGTVTEYQGITCPLRTTANNVDEYMINKHERNQELYDIFDDYMDKILENDDDDNDEEFEFKMDEMIFAINDVGIMIKNNNMEILVGSACVLMLIIIAMISLWCKYKYGKSEYQEI